MIGEREGRSVEDRKAGATEILKHSLDARCIILN